MTESVDLDRAAVRKIVTETMKMENGEAGFRLPTTYDITTQYNDLMDANHHWDTVKSALAAMDGFVGVAVGGNTAWIPVDLVAAEWGKDLAEGF